MLESRELVPIKSRMSVVRIEDIIYLSQSINRTRWEEKLREENTPRRLCEEHTQVNPRRRERG